MVKMTKTAKLEQVRAKVATLAARQAEANLASRQQEQAPLKAVMAKQVANGDTLPGKSPTALMAQLQAQGRMGPQAAAPTDENAGTANTVADDAPVNPKTAALITAQEALVRPVLALFGISYDQLIATQGSSLYGQALAARPGLAQAVLASKNPVLAALEVAVGFKPYAEFTQQYGSSLDEVKAKMKAEAAAEMRAGGKEPPAANDTGGPTLNVVFAGMRGGSKPVAKPAGRASLSEVFGR